jgi:hypothetical protein
VALAGAGGLVVGAGILSSATAALGERGTLAALAIVVVVLGYVAVTVLGKRPELRSAGVGAATIGIPALGLAMAGTDDVDQTVVVLVIAALYIVAWFLPGFRGRPVLLGLGVLSLASGIATALSSTADCSGEDAFFDERCYSDSLLPDEVVRTLGQQGAIYLVLAAVLLGAVWLHDRRGYHGIGTSFVVPGLLLAFTGASLLATRFDSTGGAALVAAVGVVVCLVGSHGERRATTWWGAVLATVGVVALVLLAIEPSSEGGVRTALILAGAVLIAGPMIVGAIRRSGQQEGAMPPPTLPPPTG